MIILGIDPGPKESALVMFDGKEIVAHAYLPNEEILNGWLPMQPGNMTVIEWIDGCGLTVGRETLETCRWVGRFEQAAGGAHLLGRKAIKGHLCNTVHTVQARDKDIRQALIDRFGESGTKKNRGATYGLVGDEWAALAVAVTWWDQHKE